MVRAPRPLCRYWPPYGSHMVQRLQAPCPRDASTKLSLPSTHDDLCPTCAQPTRMLDLGQFDLGFFDLSQFDLGQFLVAQTFLNCVVWCGEVWCVVLWCVGGCVFKIFVGASKICSPLRRTPPPPDRPNFRAFVPLPPQFSFILPSLWGSSRGILVVCVGGTFRCALFFLSKRAHFRAPTLQTPPKFHEKTPREGRKKENCGGRGEKSSKFLAPTLLGATLRGPTIRGPHPSGPHPSGPTLRGLVFAHPGGREGGGGEGGLAQSKKSL